MTSRSLVLGASATVLFITVFLFLAQAGRAEEKSIKIKLIEVKGNRRIDTTAILAKIKSKENDLFSPDRLRDDLRSIYQMGYFDQVDIQTEGFEGGVKVTFIVTEKPFISEIIFDGNKEIKTDDLKEKLTVKPQSFLDSQQVKEQAERLRTFYQGKGYYSVHIIPVIKKVTEDRATVIFFIQEGEKAKIREIRFEGNKTFPAKEIKKNLITQEYSWWSSWFTSTGFYKEEDSSNDVERVKDFYLDHGYLQIQVGNPKLTLSDDKKWFDITYTIIEGVPFTVKKIDIQGNKVLPNNEIRSVLKTKEDQLFRRNLLRQDLAAITDLYGDKGYIYANVIPQFSPSQETRTVNLLLEINEDNRIYVRQINISGNDKTRDKVIRREIKVDEQEVMNTKAIRRSFERLRNLNFFENVEIVPEPVDKEHVDLNVRVKEKSTGSFSVGGGYSSQDRFVGLFELSQGNFLGRGELLRAKVELGSRRTTYSLTFKEPYILDYQVSGTTDIFKQTRNFDTYKEKRTGGDLSFGKSFTEYVSGSVSYLLESVDIFGLTAGAPPQVRTQTGKTYTSSVGLSSTRDTRDFIFDPHQGSRLSISTEYAGLGGDNEFIKVSGDATKYFPVWFDTVLSLRARLGYAEGLNGKQLPLGERFYVGGINTVRGFAFGRAGPLVNGEIIGANTQIIFNVEYVFPLLPERVKGVVFFDAGRGYNNEIQSLPGSSISPDKITLDSLKTSIGLGLRFILPIGPIRLEYGYNLNRQAGEKPGQLEVSIGTLF
jgi:outer membrane protein insertion porin family